MSDQSESAAKSEIIGNDSRRLIMKHLEQWSKTMKHLAKSTICCVTV